jgi:hypothetical protein
VPNPPIIDEYSKTIFTLAEVTQYQADKLENGAVSCDLTEDDSFWYLTTVWP